MDEKSLVQLSTKSWHYQFMKFILGNISPTSENMFNLCPYFWLLIFSLIFCIPILIIRYILKFFGIIFSGLDWVVTKTFVEPTANSWYIKLTDLDVYQIWSYNMQIQRFYKIMYGKDYNDLDKNSFVIKWWEKKYKEKVYNENIKGNGLYTEVFKKWMYENRDEYKNLEHKPPTHVENKMDLIRLDIKAWFYNLGNWITSWRTLIKWTKRIVGLIITGAGLFATYFIVNFLGRGILYLVEHWEWHTFWCAAVGLVAIALAIFILFFLAIWFEYIKEKGLKLWYARVVYWVIYMPFKFVIYYAIWKFLIITLIVGSAKLIWNGFLGFLGIFGEYFGASYTDYCPGIKWKEEIN